MTIKYFKNIITALLFISITHLNAQTSHTLLMNGDSQYNNDNYVEAEELYRKAKEKESSLKSNFNLGNATFQQGRFEESIDFYLNAAGKAEDDKTRSDAYYNLGNSYFNNQNLEDAAESFKLAIKANPNNKNARYNLAYTKEIMKQVAQQQQDQQQQQDDQQGEDQENQEQENQDQNQDQQGQNQDQNEKEEQEQEEQEQKEQEQKEQEQDSTQQSQPMQFDSSRLEKQTLDSTDAKKLLQIIQEEEMKVQEKLRKFNSKRKKPDKDW